VVYLTRRETFNAAHKLYNPNWSEEKNIEVFGKCSNKNWHGHNYELLVTVKGTPNPDTGFIMNVKELSQIIREHVCERFDHKNLNLDIQDIIPPHLMPSTENLAIIIWNILQPLIKDATLHCIKLTETENIFVEYYGEQN
jgi:6-pyruvoyltetrahydropterin/6-carboxytetrahydropterin synthase